MSKRIIVFGGDGYIGWPLSVRLALENPKTNILIVDNHFRREAVQNLNLDSLTPIETTERRIECFNMIYNQENIDFIKLDITKEDINFLFKGWEVSAVFHLAQQASAPYSMKSIDNTIFTATNNEVGNLKILYAIRENCPNAHLIKLGSFGEYCTTEIDVAEGFFNPTFNGKTSATKMPYPRQSDDFYHASKINDSNYIHVACKNWGLKVTEIMQSTIFGISTKEINHDGMLTRFDYDEFFGTVVNRFITQAVLGENLTVYGSGHQRTGLMNLEDSVNSMSALVDGEYVLGHNIINHVTEKSLSINEIAQKVLNASKKMNLKKIEINHTFDPREENPKSKLPYKIISNYIHDNVEITDFDDSILNIMEVIVKNSNRINPKGINPSFNWNTNSNI